MHANGAPHTPFATRLRSGDGGLCPAGGSPCAVGPGPFPAPPPALTEEAHAV